MTPLPTISITLTAGTTSRAVTIADMTAALASPDPYSAISRLLFESDPQLANKGKGGWGEEDSRIEITNNDNKYSQEKTLNTVSVGEEEGSRGEEGADDAEFIHSLAEYLADRLQDRHSLAWYRLVAATASHAVIQDALSRTLDVPRSRIRKSRAAYFTALIRPHVPRLLRYPPSEPS